MDEMLGAIAARQGGVFTREQALRCGYSDEIIKRRLRSGTWTRIRRGAYAPSGLMDGLDAADRHVMIIRAVMLALPRTAVVSHVSAAMLHRLPPWGHDLHHVHVTRAGRGGGRIEARVHHHRAATPPDHVTHHDGVRVSTVARAVIEAACEAPFAAGVVLADAALCSRATTVAELHAVLDTMRSWPRSTAACQVVSFANPGAESPGESRARMLFRQEGLPVPELQALIHDRAGALAGRVDFLFREHDTVVEFDGLLKYGLGRSAPADDLFREKRREDLLRELGYEVVRITWADLAQPRVVAARIRAAFARAAARRPRGTGRLTA